MKKNTIYQFALIAIIIGAFIWSMIHPASNADWLLENSPIFLVAILLIIFGRYLKLSSFSYTLIVLYLILPLMASHYGVTGVPIGYQIGKFMGFTRNMFDRVTHFAFGFLLFYPIYEIIFSIKEKKDFWNYYIPLETIIAASALYEIFEWLSAVSVNPILAASFYGTQGDPFDTPEDMTCAIAGALISMIILIIYNKYHERFRKNFRIWN